MKRTIGTLKTVPFRSLTLLFAGAAAAFLLTSCGPPKYLVQDDVPPQPGSDKALVRFISPKAVGYVFDSEDVIGFAFPNTHFDYVTDPGKHLFITSLENKAFMEADLLPGKTYYVLMRAYMGVWRGRIAFLPVNKDTELVTQAKEFEAKSKLYRLDEETKRAWQAKYGPTMPTLIENYNNVLSMEYDWPKLNQHDWMQ